MLLSGLIGNRAERIRAGALVRGGVAVVGPVLGLLGADSCRSAGQGLLRVRAVLAAAVPVRLHLRVQPVGSAQLLVQGPLGLPGGALPLLSLLAQAPGVRLCGFSLESRGFCLFGLTGEAVMLARGVTAQMVGGGAVGLTLLPTSAGDHRGDDRDHHDQHHQADDQPEDLFLGHEGCPLLSGLRRGAGDVMMRTLCHRAPSRSRAAQPPSRIPDGQLLAWSSGCGTGQVLPCISSRVANVTSRSSCCMLSGPVSPSQVAAHRR